jgi:hypothetical protein
MRHTTSWLGAAGELGVAFVVPSARYIIIPVNCSVPLVGNGLGRAAGSITLKVSHSCRKWTSFRIHCAASALETIRGVHPLPWGWWGFPVSGMGRWSLPSLIPAGTVGGPQTLPESFRPTGPLSGYLIFLTKLVHGVLRTIILRGDRSSSAPGLAHLPSPPASLIPPILTLFSCVI